MNVCDIRDIQSESGVVASLIFHPEFSFFSEQLRPNHFSDDDNGYLYFAISELAKKGIEKIDAYNITNILNMRDATRHKVDHLTVEVINEFITNAPLIARTTTEEYKLLVDNVLNAALRRDTYNKLAECQQLCFTSSETNIEEKIYNTLDNVMMDFSATSEVPRFSEVVDQYWGEIEARQDGSLAGIPFPFHELNRYATIERGELFLFGAEAKSGKSMMLLNIAVHLLKNDKAVLYVDSELSSRMFTARLMSRISGIEFHDIKAGNYGEDGKKKIEEAREWIKTKKFVHVYMPVFNSQTVYTVVKKIKHTMGLDVLIVDYFKSTGSGDAFESYAELGSFTDTVKNRICGALDIAGIGAVQTTANGKIADSARIARNASTIAIIENKTPEEIQQDGVECGNKKLRIILNRNGEQMTEGRYIDLLFTGNLIKFEQAKQHEQEEPY